MPLWLDTGNVWKILSLRRIRRGLKDCNSMIVARILLIGKNNILIYSYIHMHKNYFERWRKVWEKKWRGFDVLPRKRGLVQGRRKKSFQSLPFPPFKIWSSRNRSGTIKIKKIVYFKHFFSLFKILLCLYIQTILYRLETWKYFRW